MRAAGRQRATCGLWAACTLLIACAAEEVPGGSAVPPATSPYLLVSAISYDFQSASYGRIDLPTLTPWPNLGPLHSDHALRATGGYLFAINRYGGDNLQRLDPSTQATLWQYSTGAGTNPQDVLVVGPNRAYVTLFESADLLVIDPEASSADVLVRQRIDLSAFADADGIPEMAGLARVGQTVFVALQRLDRNQAFAPTNTSYVVGLDAQSGALVDLTPDDPSGQALELPVPNPWVLAVRGEELWIGCVGRFGQADGAVLRFDTASLTFADPLVTEADLDGDLAAILPTDPAYVLWTDFALESHVSAVDVETGAVSAVVDGLASVEDLAADDRYLYVPDRSKTAPGVRVFDRASGGEVTAAPIAVGLPPWHLEWVDPTAQP